MMHVYKVSRVKLYEGTFVSSKEYTQKNFGGIFFSELLPIYFV